MNFMPKCILFLILIFLTLEIGFAEDPVISGHDSKISLEEFQEEISYCGEVLHISRNGAL